MKRATLRRRRGVASHYVAGARRLASAAELLEQRVLLSVAMPPLAAVDPLGSQVYRSTYFGAIGPDAGAASVPINGATEDFESGVLGPAFSTSFTGSGTGAQVIPVSYDNPDKVLWLHGDYDRGTGGLVEAVWTVNLSGATDANLTFQAMHSDNHFSPFPNGDFVGHYN